MTLSEVLPLARSLDPAERLALAEEMIRSLGAEGAIDGEVLDLVEARVEHIRSHPEESTPWDEFEAAMDAEFGPIPG
ncbi:MAG: addiction module protein [Bifidobacteriaceae bacterium]|nr:addiction module protein [Bifidobacteriaceae bacterium]